MVAALSCALLEAIVGLLALDFVPAQSLDRRVWRLIAGRNPGNFARRGFLFQTDPYLHTRYYVAIGIVAVGVILMRRRWRLAVAVVVLLGAAPVSAEILKDFLTYQRSRPFVAPGQPHIAPASWPSGHATAATALGLAITVAAPRALRWYAAALGTGFVAVVSADLILGGSHFPSDLVGGYLLAALWLCLVMAVAHCSRFLRRDEST
jgi:membrane-associated phospholipid phosphatase